MATCSVTKCDIPPWSINTNRGDSIQQKTKQDDGMMKGLVMHGTID